MPKENIDYKIKAVNPSDYEMTLTLPAKNQLFTKIFHEARVKLQRKKGISVKDDLGSIDEFGIPPEYLKLIKIGIQKITQLISRQLTATKNVNLLSTDIQKCRFKKKDPENWDIIIEVSGIYAKKE